MLYEDGRAAHQRRVVGQVMYVDRHDRVDTEFGLKNAQLKVPTAAQFTQVAELKQDA
jgi:hypothetical protein